ncbi:MAG: serine hydrolase domain-containing protein [Gemmatimonadales bacterium]
MKPHPHSTLESARSRLVGGLLLGAAAAIAPGGLHAQTAIDTAKVDQVFAKFLGNDSPGCALGVYRAGSIVFARGYGMADLERSVAITPSTLFDLGSTSKQFTAAAIALLVADGKVRFEDDIRRYVPEVPDFGTPITLDHLVRHTSGLRDYIGLLNFGGRRIDDASNDAEALRIIGRQRALNFAPGTEWDYSNSGFFLLSIVVERVTGKNLAEFARERIFRPLGMNRTDFRNDHTAILRGRALGYSPGEQGGLINDVPNWDQLGDGAVWSSVEELARWDANFYEPKVGGQAMLDRLQELGHLNDGKPHGYGRGLFLDQYRGLARVHHGGAWGGYRAMLMRFPSERTSIALTCNVATAGTQGLAEGVADVILAEKLAPAEAKARETESTAAAGMPARERAPYLGLYFSEQAEMAVQVAEQSERLVLKALGTAFALSRVTADSFASASPVAAAFEGAGATKSAVRLWVLGSPRGSFSRVEQANPSASELEEFAGRYYAPELDGTFELAVTDGKLTATSRGTGTATLEPAMRDAFSGLGFIRFARDRRGRVTGFRLSLSRVKGLVFERQAQGSR